MRAARRWQFTGAAVCMAALLAIWVYQVLIVDAARIQRLLARVVGA